MEYRDITFCSYWKKCAVEDCMRALTPEVEKDAIRLGLPVCQFDGKPDCFKEKE